MVNDEDGLRGDGRLRRAVVVFAVPLTALVAAYVIVARLPWFGEWVGRLYG
jgi:hypothetical protein